MNKVSRPIIASVIVIIVLLGQLTVSAFARGAEQTADSQYSSDPSNGPSTVRRTRTPITTRTALPTKTPKATATIRATKTPIPTATRRPTRTPRPHLDGVPVDVAPAAIDDGSDSATVVADDSGN